MVECSSNLVMTVLVGIKAYRLHKVTQPNGQVIGMSVKLVSRVAVLQVLPIAQFKLDIFIEIPC